ncbi:hypothetical protein LINPERPRIM_LOCUS40309 [Linum perenne]
MAKRKHRSCTARLLPALFLLIAAFFIGGAFLLTDHKQILLRSWGLPVEVQKSVLCENEGKPHGSETLPKGIISATSDLEMRSLWGNTDKKSNTANNLLAMAVGIKQIRSVDQIVQKFPAGEFVVMLFHYDGNVDEWKGLDWSNRAIHISAINQTKWWFAKRFLHPDIISEYAYIFLWDEDLGVDNFDAGRYLSIVRAEGLEISQPALDPEKSDVHHHLTQRNTAGKVHRFVEMMAPVFSKASWRCVWHMFQVFLLLVVLPQTRSYRHQILIKLLADQLSEIGPMLSSSCSKTDGKMLQRKTHVGLIHINNEQSFKRPHDSSTLTNKHNVQSQETS